MDITQGWQANLHQCHQPHPQQKEDENERISQAAWVALLTGKPI